MEREEQLFFCRKCKKRQFDPNQGIICGLTQKRADFEKECENYVLDEAVVAMDKKKAAEEGIPARRIVASTEVLERLKSQQSIGFALVGGCLAMLVSAALWAMISVAAKYQIGYMAIGVGLLVGFTVRFFGIGFESKFGILGGAFALMGCLLGNLFSYVGVSAGQMGQSFFEVLRLVDLETAKNIMIEIFSPIDIVFYGIAVYEGYRFAIVPVTQKLVDELEEEKDKGLPFRYKLRLPLAVVSVVVMLCFAYSAGKGANMTYTVYYDSGVKKMEGEISNGKENGKWQYWDENGRLTNEGYFKEGKQDSLWITYGENGNVVGKDNYRDGLLYGLSEVYFPDGQVEASVYCENNLMNGEYVLYHENGQVARKGKMVENLAEGSWVVYYETGSLYAEGNMEKGNKVGMWRRYFQNGDLQDEIEYRDEEKVALVWQAYDSVGKPIVVNGNGYYRGEYDSELAEGEVKDGMMVGVWKRYNEDGKLLETGYYDEGAYHVMNIWNEEGDLLLKDGNGYFESSDGTMKGMYKEGFQEGVWNVYDLDGALVMEITYEKGEVVDSRTIEDIPS